MSAHRLPGYACVADGVRVRGHFCGVAQMLSAVDYNQTSTVWAQDKWKGIFKLRWIFVKDIPNG